MKIAVLTPYFGGADIEHYSSIEKLPPTITRIRFGGSSMIDQVRAALVSAAQNTFADIYFFIDSDIIFEPSDVERLAAKVSNDTPIVSGCYLAKDERNVVVGLLGQAERSNELLPALMLGFGFVAIQAKTFIKIGENLPDVVMNSAQGVRTKPWFLPMIHDGQCLGEDFSFCVRAQEAGIPMFIDQTIRVIHKGVKRYHVTDRSKFQHIPRNT